MILVNGEVAESIGVTDRGLAYGDGVFRTLVIRGARPLAWPHHFEKLLHDCDVLGIACPAEGILRAEIDRIAGDSRDCVAKIIVTRGPGERGYGLPRAATATRIVLSSALPQYPAETLSRGVAVRRCSIRLSSQPRLAGVKHLNRLENVLARAEWDDPAIMEGLLFDAAGNAVSGTMTNLFLVEGESIVTPAIAGCGVAGVTRARILVAARRLGVRASEETVDAERLMRADALMLTNSIIGVWQVASLEGKSWQAHPLAQRMRQWLHETDS